MGPVDAAAMIARRFGLVVDEPVVLSDSNNVVVWLPPAPVVAKVGTGHHGRLAHELAVAKHLSSVGAPIVPASRAVPSEVQVCDGFDVTFWEYHPRLEEGIDSRHLANALFELHDGLAGYTGALPSFRAELDAVRELLVDGRAVSALQDNERALLVSWLDALVATLLERRRDDQVLHGSPHDANVIVVAGEPRFIDFETVCVGPLEWDLAHLSSGVARAYGVACDAEAIRVCRGLVSIKTAAWCWARIDHPGMRWHAEHHLAVVRRLSTSR